MLVTMIGSLGPRPDGRRAIPGRVRSTRGAQRRRAGAHARRASGGYESCSRATAQRAMRAWVHLRSGRERLRDTATSTA